MPFSHRFSLLIGLALALPARAQTAPPLQLPAARYERQTRTLPPQRIEIVRIDLSDPDVEVRVAPGGLDPDGDGPYQTTLQPLSTIAERERFDVAINGDFFAAKQTVDVEGEKSGYVAGKWALAIGPAATDGHVWAPASRGPRPALIFDAQKRARIAPIDAVTEGARQVIAGSHILIQAGKIVIGDEAGFVRTRHPRSAAGLADAGRTLILLVADGRRAGEATGLSLPELAQIMLDLGCQEALNLDGGGSSQLMLRDAQGQLQILNRPSDGRERAIANALGVSIRGSLRVPKTAVAPTAPATAAPAPTAPATQ